MTNASLARVRRSEPFIGTWLSIGSPIIAELAAAAGFDWLLFDGEIVPIDGFELSRKGKDMQPKMSIAMLSGIYVPADIKGRPIEKLIQKPLDTHALISYLREPPRT